MAGVYEEYKKEEALKRTSLEKRKTINHLCINVNNAKKHFQCMHHGVCDTAAVVRYRTHYQGEHLLSTEVRA